MAAASSATALRVAAIAIAAPDTSLPGLRERVLRKALEGELLSLVVAESKMLTTKEYTAAWHVISKSHDVTPEDKHAARLTLLEAILGEVPARVPVP